MTKSKIQIIGIPFDAKSSYLRGPANAPVRIIEELFSPAYNPYSEQLKKVLAKEVLHNYGNLQISKYEEILPQVSDLLASPLFKSKQTKPLFLGGDHSISYPLVKACHEHFGPFHILHFDAHPDLNEAYQDDRFSHACPFARILEENLALSLTQVGIRASSPAQMKRAEENGVHQFSMRDIEKFSPTVLKGPIYVSLDIDVFDPAYAPGVSHQESGGIAPRQFLNWLQYINVPIVGADVVEYNPLRDVQGMTAALSAKMIKELLCRMIN